MQLVSNSQQLDYICVPHVSCPVQRSGSARACLSIHLSPCEHHCRTISQQVLPDSRRRQLAGAHRIATNVWLLPCALPEQRSAVVCNRCHLCTQFMLGSAGGSANAFPDFVRLRTAAVVGPYGLGMPLQYRLQLCDIALLCSSASTFQEIKLF